VIESRLWTLGVLTCSIFTARCYAERGIVTASRPSVCLSVCGPCSFYLGHVKNFYVM